MLSGMELDDLYKVRWKRFRQLAGHHGGISDAAARLDKSQGQVSHFGGKNPRKSIGEQIAREIEAAYGKPRGWLDTLNDSILPTNGIVPASEPSRTLNAASVAEAEKWVRFEERRKGKLQPMRRAERLIALYEMVEADGGSLSPEHAEAIIQRGVQIEHGTEDRKEVG